MSARFEAALAFVLAKEGGYVDDPDDRGGATNRGITQKTYDAYRRARGLPYQPVRLLADAEVRDIYRTRYWQPARCDDLPWPLDLMVFDTAVNSGPARAVKLLQEAARAPIDGECGPQTLAAVAAMPVDRLAERYQLARLAWIAEILRRDPTQRKFAAGWLVRIDDLCQAA